MPSSLKALGIVVAFFLLILAPVLLLFAGLRPEGREFWRELSVGLGFAGLSLIGIQFLPTARMPFLANLFPMDTLYQFHHKTSIAGSCLALLHPIILFVGDPAHLELLDVVNAPWRARAAVAAVVLLGVLMVSSLWRKRIGLRYQSWRAVHYIAALGIAVLVLYHILMVNYHTAYPLQRVYWFAMAVVWVGSALYVRVLRPLQLLRRPYRVLEVRPERGGAWTVAMAADGHAGLRFIAGQFAWLIVRSSPFSFTANPFSFSSSAEDRERLEFTIKEVGDFTRLIKQLHPNEEVYVDGPYGTFDIDQHAAPGYGLIAGGIGSTPILSILRTMADRQDLRPVIFFYGNRDWEQVTFREDLAELEKRVKNLKVVHVLERPPADWQGERGYITAELLERHLPANRAQLRYFICGPIPMIVAVEKALLKLGVPLSRIHTENYEMA